MRLLKMQYNFEADITDGLEVGSWKLEAISNSKVPKWSLSLVYEMKEKPEISQQIIIIIIDEKVREIYCLM